MDIAILLRTLPLMISRKMPAEVASLVCGTPPPLFAYDADIIILALNRFSETMEAVESALRQSGISLHVTVLDQGSDPEIQERFLARFAGLDKLAYYTIGRNLGVGGGRNRLAALGHGRIIIALDNDAVFENETVAARAVAAFEVRPTLGALAFKILDRDGVHLDEIFLGLPDAAEKPFPGAIRNLDFRRCRPRHPPPHLGRSRRLRRGTVLHLGRIRLLPGRHRPRLVD